MWLVLLVLALMLDLPPLLARYMPRRRSLRVSTALLRTGKDHFLAIFVKIAVIRGRHSTSLTFMVQKLNPCCAPLIAYR